MDVASFAISVTTITGAVRDCLDLYAAFTVAKALGKDYFVSLAKLDVEKTLLLQWAQRVRLDQQDYDHRLDEPSTQSAVSSVLGSIRQLLGDGDNLQSKYGVQESTVTEETGVSPALSGPRMREFVENLKKHSPLLRVKRRDISIHQRVKWTIVDRDKFKALVSDLSYFRQSLDDMIPDHEGVFVHMMKRDLESAGRRELKLVLGASREDVGGLHTAVEKQWAAQCYQRILSTVGFRSMNERRTHTEPPHARTLQWMLDSTQASPGVV